jgi:hypothetical protein
MLCRPQVMASPRGLNLRARDGQPLEAVITAGLAQRSAVATVAHFRPLRGAAPVGARAGGDADPGPGLLVLGLAGARPACAAAEDAGPGAALGPRSEPGGSRRRLAGLRQQHLSQVLERGAGRAAGADREDDFWPIMDACTRGCLLARLRPAPAGRLPARLPRLLPPCSSPPGTGADPQAALFSFVFSK